MHGGKTRSDVTPLALREEPCAVYEVNPSVKDFSVWKDSVSGGGLRPSETEQLHQFPILSAGA